MATLAAATLFWHAPAAALAVSASFDSFLERGLGSWRGASYTWTPSAATESSGLMPLGVVPGCIAPPEPCSSEISEVMRACGGAVQGVREQRQPSGGEVVLNRQVDGVSFFSSGSWAQAPAALRSPGDASDGEETLLIDTAGAFGVSLSLAHGDGTRRRLLLACVGGVLTAADVIIEGRPSAPPPDVTEQLLGRRMQLIVECNAWEGGGDVFELTGAAASGQWLNERVRWRRTERRIAGGDPLLPPQEGTVFLPGGCWVRLEPACGDGGASLRLEAGSISVEAAETKALVYEYEPDEAAGKGALQLSRVQYRTVLTG